MYAGVYIVIIQINIYRMHMIVVLQVDKVALNAIQCNDAFNELNTIVQRM